MGLRSSFIALFLHFVFGVSGMGKPMAQEVMADRLHGPWNDVKLQGVISRAKHPEADTARQADDILNVPASVCVVSTHQTESRTDLYACKSVCDAPGVVVRDNGEGVSTAVRFRGLRGNHPNGNPIGSVIGVPFDTHYCHDSGNTEGVRPASAGATLRGRNRPSQTIPTRGA